jgi:predicted RNA-binding protein with PIN domain
VKFIVDGYFKIKTISRLKSEIDIYLAEPRIKFVKNYNVINFWKETFFITKKKMERHH